MAIIKEVRGKSPVFGEECWFAENSVIVGDVKMGSFCTVWFSAVVRGDVNSITIGDRVNIQDNATIHCTYETAATIIGNDVSIGHNAIVHGCTLHNQVLVGMGSIIMDNAIIGEGAIVAAGSVVLANSVIEPGMIYAGSPARKIKPVEGKNLEMIKRISGNYLKYASWFKE